jgi:plastocyanin
MKRIAGLKVIALALWGIVAIESVVLTCAVAATTSKAPAVHINGADYGPLPTGLKAGDTITFSNDDTVAHTVTARDHSFDLHLNPGQSAKLTLPKDGSYPIYCIYHSTMRGVLVAAAH